MKSVNKIIAIILTMLTLISVMSAANPVLAAEVTQLVENDNAENVDSQKVINDAEKNENNESEILNEMVEWRTESTKYFRNSDGSYTAAQYAYPVHYKENGEWKEIDNTLSEETVGNNLLNAEKEFVAKNTNTPAKFPNEFRQDGSKEITVSTEGYDISFSPKANQKGLKASNGDIKDREDLDSVKIVEKFNDKKEEKTSSFKATNLSKKAEIEKNKEEKFKVENKSGAIVYEDVFNSVDLEYELNNSQIKESIVLEEKQDEYVFEFAMNLGELHPVICEDGSINLCSDEEGKEIVAKIEAPYMVDSNGEYSEAVTMTIAENGKEYILTVVADEKWLNDESRAYPVVIDPTIDLLTNRANTFDCYVDNSQPNTGFSYDYYIYTGNSSLGKTRAYIKFSLPELPDENCIVTKANVSFWQNSVDKGSADGYLTIHEVTGNWNNTDSSLLPTWNNKPTYDSTVLDYAKIEVNEGDVAHCYQFDITKTVKKWYEGVTNYGLMLKTQSESVVNRVQLYSAENTVCDNYPTICVSFKNSKGIEDYWSFSDFEVGCNGIANVNDYTGNLVYELPILSSISERMPVTLIGYYNNCCANELICENQSENVRTSIGRGFRLNYQQTVLSSTEYGLSGTEGEKYPYVYTDGDGTEHYIQKVTKDGKITYKDESGLGITFTTDFEEEGAYRLTDKAHNKYYFNNKGNLFRIKDNNGNEINIKYKSASSDDDLSEESRISQIIDGAGHTYTFTYYKKSSTNVELDYVEKITDDAGRVYNFTISNGLLLKVNYPDKNSVEIDYNISSDDSSEGRINSIISNDNYELNFDYTSKSTGRRVKTVKEYGISLNSDNTYSYTKGEVVTFDHTNHNTTIIRSCGMDGIHNSDNSSYGEDDVITTVQFDNIGRTISEHYKYGSNEEVGMSLNTFSSSESDTSTSGSKNKISDSNFVGKSVRNLLYGGNAESLTGWSLGKSGTITVATGLSSASQYIGQKSIKLTASNIGSEGARCYYRQNVTDFEKGSDYTLSAYVKTGDLVSYSNAALTGAFIQLIAYDSDGNSIESVRSPILTERSDTSINDGWRRLHVTINAPQNAVSIRCYLFLRNTEGSVCFDGIQLEKGSTPNDYNMLENAGFEDSTDYVPNSWSGTSQFVFSTGSTVKNGVTTTTDLQGKSTNAMKITGEENVEKGISQTVAVMGNEDDTYILSGWAKGYPINSTFHTTGSGDNVEETVLFEIAVKVNYSVSDGSTVSQFKKAAKFNTSVTGWQCASIPIILKYTGDTDGYTYTPTSIKIIPRYNNQANYGFFDNIMLVRDVASSYTYDNEGNTLCVSSNSEQKEYMTYDSYSNLISYTDTAGYTTTSEYDENNNLWREKSSKGLYTRYNYDSYGNIDVVEISDASTNEDSTCVIRTNNQYNEETTIDGITINAGAYQTNYQDENGNMTSYTRDLKTGTLTSVTDAKGTQTVYEYYDTFGKKRSIATGGSKVVYGYNSNNQLDNITFGNTNQEVYSFTYDVFGNIKNTAIGNQVISTKTYNVYNDEIETLTYGNGDTERYVYNNLGQKTEIFDTDLNSATTTEKRLYSWKYNDSGVVLSHTDHVNGYRYFFDYDALGRLSKEETQNSSDSSYVGSIEYKYDVRNNLTKLLTNFGGKSRNQRYFYSEYDLGVNSAEYAKDNLPTVYKLYESRYAVYDYDALNRLVQRDFSTNNPLYYNYVYKMSDNRNISDSDQFQTDQIKEEYIGDDVYIYGYDVLGNITSIKKAKRSIVGSNSTSYTNLTDYRSYEYDNLGQLTREDNAVYNKIKIWSYDELGNILKLKIYPYSTSNLGTEEKTITYNYGNDGKNGWNNLLISVDFDGDSIVDSDEVITYDQIGNPTTYLGASLTWNGRQLTGYNRTSDSISYTYNSDGLRNSKTVNGSKTEYTYVNGQLHYENRGNGTKLYYYYDSNGYLSGIEYNGTNYYPATNLSGDVVAIYNYQGSLIAGYEYDAWGNMISIKDANGNEITDPTHIANVNPIRYRGYYWDFETRLYYLQSRYYNPEIGRFLNADDIKYLDATGTVLGCNIFAYCENNPMNNIDNSGFMAVSMALAKIIVTAIAIAVTSYLGWEAIQSIMSNRTRTRGYNYDKVKRSTYFNSTKRSFSFFY